MLNIMCMFTVPPSLAINPVARSLQSGAYIGRREGCRAAECNLLHSVPQGEGLRLLEGRSIGRHIGTEEAWSPTRSLLADSNSVQAVRLPTLLHGVDGSDPLSPDHGLGIVGRLVGSL